MALERVTVEERLCKGCELCVWVCPKNIMELQMDKMNDKGYHPATCIDQDACIMCAMCGTICPDLCIEVKDDRIKK